MDGNYLCDATTKDTFLMYSNGAFPTISPDCFGVPIQGELYCCDDDVMARLDLLESNGDLYTREELVVDTETGTARAWAYIYNYDQYGDQVVDGNFNHSHYAGDPQ